MSKIGQSSDRLEPHDLPVWMRRAVRGTDWGVVFAVLFSLLAAWSFAFQSSVSRTGDYERYLFRAAETAHTLREGRLYARWSAAALSGYGAPIPNYTPPLPAYLPSIVDTLATNNTVTAMNIVCLAAFPIAGAAVYVFIARRRGGAAGLIAAILYIYSPSVGIIAPHLNGDVPRVLLHALIPAFLWAFDGVIIARRPQDYVALIGLTAAVMLTDPIWLVFALILALPLLLPTVTHGTRPRQMIHLMLAILLGLGLSAFYWLPAWREQSLIRWEPAPILHTGEITLSGLFTPFSPLDPEALHPLFPYSLGLPLIAAVLAIIPLIFRRGSVLERLYLLIGVAGCLLLVTRFSDRTEWLGVMVLSLSLAASALTEWRRHIAPLARRVLVPLILATIVISAYGVWLTPHWRSGLIDLSGAAQIAFEQSGYGTAVLPAADPVPVPLLLNPPERASTAGALTAASPIEIVTGGGSAQVGTLSTQSHHYSFQVRTLAVLAVRLLVAWFPGWQLSNTNIAASLAPTEDGLMEITVDANQTGEFSIDFDSNPIRQIAWWVAGLSAAASLLTLFLFRDRPGTTVDLYPLVSREEGTLIGIVLVAFAAALALFATPLSPYPISSTPGVDLSSGFALRSRTDAGLEALSYELDRADYRSGETIRFAVYWRTLRFLDQNYDVRASLVDPATGSPVAVSPFRLLGNYPTRRWFTDQHVRDEYALSIPENIPAGTYHLAIEIRMCDSDFVCEADTALAFFNPNGIGLGRSLLLPVEIRVAAG